MKVDRMGGEKEREIELGRGLRKGHGGDTGRNDEHKEVIVTKRNQFLSKKTSPICVTIVPFYSREMRERDDQM